MGDYPPGRVPETDEIAAWIREVVEQGVRRPGHAADQWTERWALRRFEEFGLADARLEPLDTPCWRPRSATLEVWPAGRPGDARVFTGSAIPYTRPTGPADGVTARLARLGDEGAAGAIAVQELAFTRVPQGTVMRAKASGSYDPENVFDELVQTVPFDLPHAMDVNAAVKAEAAAYVGLLTGVPWETHDYYWPIDAVRRPIPTIYLSAGDGKQVLALMAAGECEARIVSDAEITEETTHNVIGTLPGASDHWVIVGSHHDGPYASAVEDASGVSLVLAQAKYWASVPREQRPHNLLFLLSSGHMAGVAGGRAFLESRRDLLPDVVLEVHLEHAARHCEVVDGEIVPTDDPEVRWWFTTETPRLEKLVAESIAAEDLKRSWILPPNAFERMPLTDGAYFYPAGVPLVQHISVPMYLLDPSDTIEKIHEPSLVPLTRAAARIIAGTTGLTPGDLRTET
ncbi:M28 family peptidase [Actinomadura sp. 9N215]|uniref:M28 family peptidase n=1 Tax=Actinomadura sp. 9N215 TaxID=3375150 RepID=UPI00379FFC7F